MPRVNHFDKLVSVEDALDVLLSLIKPLERTSKIELENADNRILAHDVIAPKDFPHYDMSFMDGYAVRAEDTRGCSPDSPKFLKLSEGVRLESGFCSQLHTGSDLPEGADAVIKLEDTKNEKDGLMAYREVAVGENITPRGKTVKKGDLLYKKGFQLKPTNIAMLATLGLAEIEVFERPKVLVIPTGDEIIERGLEAGPGRINESNGLMCYLFVRRYGGMATVINIVPDDVEKLAESLRRGLKYDLIVTSGGSSVGKRDHMPEVIESMGKVLVHGVGLKPGRPMGIGYVGQERAMTPIIFLPGFPDACAVGTMMFGDRAIKKLGHYPETRYLKRTVILSERISSFRGTKAVAKVVVEDGKAAPVSTIGPAPYDGEYAYVIVPDDVDGYDALSEVESIYLE